jgi:phosphate transport system substrate-binding protein
MERSKRWSWLVAVAVALALVAAACGDDDDDTAAAAAGVSGTIDISGSSTVEPISVRVAELLVEENPDIAVNVDGPGTGDGFKLFCEGETDISDASRAIKEEEAQACADAGIEFVELQIANDGLTVMTSPGNDEVECLSLADLYALTGPESEGFDNWRDAAPLAKELGSDTTFPDLPLEITAPGEESGTYDAFIELALLGPAEARMEAGTITEEQVETTRKDYTSQANDDAIIQGIGGSDGSFGWVGFAFAQNAGEGVKELAVESEDGECVAPTAETIADHSYPLSRPLYIYVNKARAEENPALAAYVDFYVGDGYAAVEEVGYVALDDETLAATTDRWEALSAGRTVAP